MNTKRFFITGTDTEIGKTCMTGGLLTALAHQGFSTLGIKPVAAGCEATPDGLRNEDALHLQQHATVKLPYDQINPIALPEPIAPHLAASLNNVTLSCETLLQGCEPALCATSDFQFIEGAGGWEVPLNDTESLPDFVSALGCPVILVVGLRLGCLNHGILSYKAIEARGLRVAGWIANGLTETMPMRDENIRTLTAHFDAPRLGVVPFLRDPSPAAIAQHLNLITLTAS